MIEEKLRVMKLEGQRLTATIEYRRLLAQKKISGDPLSEECVKRLFASLSIKIENLKKKIDETEISSNNNKKKKKKKKREMRLSLYMQKSEKLSEIKELDEKINKDNRSYEKLEKSLHSLEEKLFPDLRKLRVLRPYQSIKSGDDFHLVYYMCLYGGKSVAFAIGSGAQRDPDQVALLRARFEADFGCARLSEIVGTNGLEAGKLYMAEPFEDEKKKKRKVSVDVVEKSRWAEYGFCGSDD
ncbi:OLC1v1009576C1 [Oldenlandia corymbosa var. corymbosa]|uniref:OLC1v1009576C1 n=1 Tax=Oldenlandia corymbosa var. corymbosa TaxID=529605 RepID=A0AAV1DP87_OLDCO|nr:OLC1v1009576C1 [Oldenlandia corymbosa var. corymbosa]